MANEITCNATLQYEDSEATSLSLQITDLLASVSSKVPRAGKQNIGTSEEAINLGETTTPGWAMFINRSTTNFVELRVATGGAKFAKLLPGEFCFLRLGSGAQAPFAIADTNPVQLEILLTNT